MRPIFSIIIALIFTVLCTLCVFIIGYFSAVDSGYQFFFLFLIIVSFGGLIVAWYSKDNKVKYSIYYGLIIVLYMIINALFRKSFSALDPLSLILILIAAGIGGLIVRNDEKAIKSLLNNKFQVDYKNFIFSLYKRNKIYLIISLAIFLVSAVIGGVGPYLSGLMNHYTTSLWTQYISGLPKNNISTLSIFMNNGDLTFFHLYINGIIFGISNTIELVYIGLLNGFGFVKYPVYSIIYILPHGVFEVSGYIVGCAAGYKLLSTTINLVRDAFYRKRDAPITKHLNNILNLHYLEFRDSLTLLSIALIILLGAAAIEANTVVASPTSQKNKVFENQFIKFNYSSNLNVVDNSNNTTLNVTIYDGNVDPSDYQVNAVGTIFVTDNINKNPPNAKLKNTTISGYPAQVEYDQGDSGATIYLNDDTGLYVLIDPLHDSYVNTIINSFVVKKAPPQCTYSTNKT